MATTRTTQSPSIDEGFATICAGRESVEFSSFDLFPRGDDLSDLLFGGPSGLFGPRTGPSSIADDFRDSLTDTTAAFGALAPGGSSTGRIETRGDADLFAIALVAGQSYTFDLRGGASGGLSDPTLRLLDGAGRQLASNDDFGGSLNSRITYTARNSGTFYLDARGFSSQTGAYTLSASGGPTTPPPTPTDDFRDSLTDTTAPLGTVSVGTPRTGSIETAGDRDLFGIALTAGRTYTFDLTGAATGGLQGPGLRVLDGAGTQLAANAGTGNGSRVTFTAASSGTFYLEARGVAASATGAYALTAAAAPATPPAAGTFDIQIRYTGDARFQAAFDEAATRWEQVIVADIPDFNSRRFGAIDDLLIDASAVAIDGRNGVLGRAGPDELRAGSFLPAHGIMEFDSADLQPMADNGTLVDVILHEMGHVLGLGTVWDQRGLKSGEFAYTGQNALREYRTLSGNPNATSIPLETTGGPGTAGGHWSDATFGQELMTGYAGGTMALSRMTIGSLQDIGYGVNYAAADPYSLATRSLTSPDGPTPDLLIV